MEAAFHCSPNGSRQFLNGMMTCLADGGGKHIFKPSMDYTWSIGVPIHWQRIVAEYFEKFNQQCGANVLPALQCGDEAFLRIAVLKVSQVALATKLHTWMPNHFDAFFAK